MANHKKYFPGQIYEVNGGTLEILNRDYIGTEGTHTRYVWVKWKDDFGHEQRVRIDTLLTGSIRNPFQPTVEGVGFHGVGRHTTREREKYNSWASMIARCYRPQVKAKYPNYELCTCSDEWKCYQNFGDFFEADQYRKKGWHLDKDLLVPGNKLYSAETCVFLPPALNSLVMYKTSKTESGFKGVWYDTKYKRYLAQCRVFGKEGVKTLGRYDTAEEASQVVMMTEANNYKYQAEAWEGKVDPRAIEALLFISKLRLEKAA